MYSTNVSKLRGNIRYTGNAENIQGSIYESRDQGRKVTLYSNNKFQSCKKNSQYLVSTFYTLGLVQH